MTSTAKIVNDTGPEIVIDGGGKVTLSGGGQRRILYMNTCDEAQVWTTSHCQNQDHPRLTVQNLTFVDGNATGDDHRGGGGGAIFVRGGRFKVVNSRFFRNVCDATGPDVGGAAVRVLEPVPGPAGLRRQQHLRRRGGLGQRVLQRRGAQQHRRLVDDAQQPVQPQRRDRQRRQPRPARHARRRQRRRIYIDGNMFTLRSPARSSRTTTPTRAAAPSSS